MTEKELILVVDDNRQNLKMLESFLQEEGYVTVTAPNGEQALQTLKNQEEIKLILLDVLMPGIDGIEVCKKIKFEMGRDDLPIILVTSLDAREDRLEGLEAGADDFITKPIDWAELKARVKSLLRFKRAHDRVEEQHQRLEHQLELARRVQRGLANFDFPPELTGEIFYQPVDKIGGDVYDIVSLSKGEYGILLADAMGHGVPAAMIMVMVKLIFKNLNCKKLAPESVIEEINRRLMEIFQREIDEIFVTGIYLKYNRAKQELTWCNAGHPSPLLFNNDIEEIKELSASDVPIGFIEDNNFEGEITDVTNFTEIFLYTDGLAEHMNSESPALSQKIMRSIRKGVKEKEAKETTTAFYKQLEEELISKKRKDDITYMLLKF